MPNDDDEQDHMFRFIPFKEVNRSATFGLRGCNTKRVARHDHQAVARQKHACSFCAVSEPCRSTGMSPGLAVMISVDFDSDVALRTQIPVFNTKN